MNPAHVIGEPCSKCGSTVRHKAAGREFGRCVDCQQKYYLQRASQNPKERLIRTYRERGLDEQQIAVAMTSSQGDFCYSCGKFDRLVLDHDHATGLARGMVCSSCNTVAGGLEHKNRAVVESYLAKKANL